MGFCADRLLHIWYLAFWLNSFRSFCFEERYMDYNIWCDKLYILGNNYEQDYFSINNKIWIQFMNNIVTNFIHIC